MTPWKPRVVAQQALHDAGADRGRHPRLDGVDGDVAGHDHRRARLDRGLERHQVGAPQLGQRLALLGQRVVAVAGDRAEAGEVLDRRDDAGVEVALDGRGDHLGRHIAVRGVGAGAHHRAAVRVDVGDRGHHHRHAQAAQGPAVVPRDLPGVRRVAVRADRRRRGDRVDADLEALDDAALLVDGHEQRKPVGLVADLVQLAGQPVDLVGAVDDLRPEEDAAERRGGQRLVGRVDAVHQLVALRLGRARLPGRRSPRSPASARCWPARPASSRRPCRGPGPARPRSGPSRSARPGRRSVMRGRRTTRRGTRNLRCAGRRRSPRSSWSGPAGGPVRPSRPWRPWREPADVARAARAARPADVARAALGARPADVARAARGAQLAGAAGGRLVAAVLIAVHCVIPPTLARWPTRWRRAP